jgi:hypothetical protein
VPKKKISPNQKKTEARIERIRLRTESGLVSEHFPGVSHLLVRMIYRNKATPLLMIRTVNFASSDNAYFNMACMDRDCMNGGFDLTQEIDDLVKTHKDSAQGRMHCNGLDKVPASCSAMIDYVISISYR